MFSQAPGPLLCVLVLSLAGDLRARPHRPFTPGRAFSNTFAGIASNSVRPYVAAQLFGAAFGWLLVRALFPLVTPMPAATRG
jgi:hypothetical protein